MKQLFDPNLYRLELNTRQMKVVYAAMVELAMKGHDARSLVAKEIFERMERQGWLK